MKKHTTNSDVETASQAMTRLESEAMELLKKIDNGIHDLPAPDSEPLGSGLNWGHVGSLGHLVGLLREASAFINCED